MGPHGCVVVAPVYDNEALTGHPDEMDFPCVDISDCVVTAGLRECGLIIYKDLCSAVIETGLGSVDYDKWRAACKMSG